jgi:thymidylate kinase
VLSSLAYQTAAGVPREVVAQANADIRLPDLTLFFELPVRVAAERRAARAGTVEIYDDDSVQQQVAATYAREARALQASGANVVFIDASRSRDEVEQALRAAITQAFPELTVP